MSVGNSSGVNFGRVDKTRPADFRFQSMVENVMMTRHELIHKLMDPRRNIDDECGHPVTEEVTSDMYRSLFDRHPIGNRVVSLFPSECWKIQPTVYESEDPEEQTEFEVTWDALGKSLAGTGWYKTEKGSLIWEYLQRIDTMAGIGSFGLLLLGIDDGRPLNEPVAGLSDKGIAGVNGTKQKRKLLYLRVFDESLVQVTRYETDVTNPRFGQPLEYLINFQDPTQQTHGGIGTQVATKSVHWSRVIHVADNLTSNETFGVPRMLPVLNPVLDLAKLYGGSAEMYWRGAFPGFSLETNPQLGGDVEVDADDLKDQMEQYMNGLQRYMALMGMTAKSLAPQVVDPVSQIQVQIEAICIELAIPVRIFMGSERGELASSQDADTWEGRLQNRRARYITPKIIVPFVDRLIAIGVLPEPKEYFVSWDKTETLTKIEQLNVVSAQTSAIAQYVSSGAEALLSPLDFLTRLLGIEEEEAQAILETAAESYEEVHPEPDPSQLPPEEQAGTRTDTEPENEQEGFPINPKQAPNQGAVKNVFCPTGEGGGIDPGCQKEGGAGGSSAGKSSTSHGGAFYGLKDKEVPKLEILNRRGSKGKVESYSSEFSIARIPFTVFIMFNGQPGASGSWSMSFESEGAYNRTDKLGSKAVGVFRRVGAVVDQFIKKEHPSRFKFSASKEEKSRVALYNGLGKVIEARHDYSFTVAEDPNEKIFYFTKKKNKTTNKESLSESFAETFDRFFGDISVEEDEALIDNVFCPTGEGGGIDPTCSPGPSGIALPPLPGTAAIKPGYVRLYHQTTEENLHSIEKEGLLFSHARGIEGPRAIYASDTPFYGDPTKRPTLEFQVPVSDFYGTQVTRDVMPEDFVAVHYPWHKYARYIEDNPRVLKETLAGDNDNLMDEPEYGPAIRYIKAKYSKAKDKKEK